MKKGSAANIIISASGFLLFILLIILIKNVDVAAIGPEGTKIGFSHVNQSFHRLFGVKPGWYKLTEVFGILALVVVGFFAVLGLIQLIRRRSLFKVDQTILKLGCFYILVLATYAFFEKVVINYRPVIEEGKEHVEASFPSSHTMLVCTVFGTLIMVLGEYIKDEKLLLIARILCGVLIVLTVFGRLICGVHWFTDILGGCLISLSYVSLFACFVFTE